MVEDQPHAALLDLRIDLLRLDGHPSNSERCGIKPGALHSDDNESYDSVVLLMTLRSYDETLILDRLAALGRNAKTVFAVSCAQLLLPLFRRYAHSSAVPEKASRLEEIVTATWEAASGRGAELSAEQLEAERMVPTDEHGWTLVMGYGQNAAAAAAYAIRTWRADDPREAARAARQVYELADYAALQTQPAFDLNVPGGEAAVLATDIVQEALKAIDRSLVAVEAMPTSWERLRADTEAESRTWVLTLP